MASLANQIDVLHRAINQAHNAKPGPSKAALHRRVISLAAELESHVDRLVDKLEIQWTWLEENPEDPKVDARTETFITTLRTYETLCDVIQAVECLLVKDAA